MTHPLSFTLDKHKKGGTLQFLIYGDIGMDFFGEGVSARNIVEVLSENQDVSAIEVRINSGGGSAFDGIAIYNVLRQHPAPVTVFIDGIAASAASVIAMAGTEVNIATGAMIMIHNSGNGTHGDNREHRKMAEVLAALDNQIASIYMDRNGLNLKDTLALMAAETWFGASEAVEAGMADNVVGAVEAVASIDLSGYGYSSVPRAVAGPNAIVNASGAVVGWTTGKPSADDAWAEHARLVMSDPMSKSTRLRKLAEIQRAFDNKTTAPTPAHGETDMKIFAQAAGLPDGASDAEIVAKISGYEKSTAVAATLQTKLTALTAAVGAEGDEALGKIEAGKVALEMVAKQTAKLEAIAAATEKDAHAALVAQGKKDGKLTADLERLFKDKPSTELKAFLAVAPKTIPMGTEHKSGEDGESVDHETLTYKGKTYAKMSGNEKSALSKADPGQFQAMSDQYRENLHPNAAL